MDSEININLDDSSKPNFDESGKAILPGVPEMDTDLAEVYAQMVEHFEQRIENSPEVQDQRAATRAADELADLTAAIDRVAQGLPVLGPAVLPESPRTTTEFGRIAEVPPDEWWNDDSPNAGDGGRIPPGDDPPDNRDDPLPSDMPTPQEEEAERIGPNGGDGGNGGGDEPPTDGVDALVDGLTGGATGIGMLFGPEIGTAINVLGDGVDAAIVAFEGLVEIVNAVDDAMQSIVEDTRAFSPEVAGASAERDIANLMVNIDRAEKVGPEISKWIETRTEIDVLTGKMATDVAEVLIPVVQEGTETIKELLLVVQALSASGLLFEKHVGILPAAFETIIASVTGTGGRIGKLMSDIKKILAKAEADEATKNLHGRFTEFLTQQAQPILGIGPNGQPEVQGGLK